MLVKTFAAALQGISATIITIKVNCKRKKRALNNHSKKDLLM